MARLTKRAQDVKVVTVAPRIAAGGLAAVEAALTSVRMGVMRMDPNMNNAVAKYNRILGDGETALAGRIRREQQGGVSHHHRLRRHGHGQGVRAALFSQILP